MNKKFRIENVFGPVPSRRLGRSLGINNIPFKACSYSCLYCQCGKTRGRQSFRQKFYDSDDIIDVVKKTAFNDRRPAIDFITIVPDGEPTLDLNLDMLTEKLKQFDIPVAVITNSSLMDNRDVWQDLSKADYVSLKIDSVNEKIWRKINKPCSGLRLTKILNGIISFAENFSGTLVTETMLLNGMNDRNDEVSEISGFIGQIKPAIAYLAIPTRPPTYKNTEPASEVNLIEAFETFSQEIKNVEILNEYEGEAFSSTGDFVRDILSITSVHPLREEAVFALAKQTNDNINLLNRLVSKKLVNRILYDGHIYYLRNFNVEP